MAFIMIYITHENAGQADRITSHLLKQKLIACANTFPITSAYWWKKEIDSEGEVVSIVKTKKENWEKVKSEVKKIHPYEVPCIIKVEVEANQEYEAWIDAETA